MSWNVAVRDYDGCRYVAGGVVRLDGQVETRSLALIAARLSGLSRVVGVESRLRWKVDDSRVPVPDHPLALHYIP